MSVGLYLINIVLLTRLSLMLRDKQVDATRAATMCAVQAVALLALEPSFGVGLLAIGIAMLNGAWFIAERRFPRRFNIIRLGILAAFLILLGFFCSPMAGLSFRASLASDLSQTGQYFALADRLPVLAWRRIHSYALGALLCMSEANMMVRMVIERLELRPGNNTMGNLEKRVNNEYKRGRIIGLLERLVLFFWCSKGNSARWVSSLRRRPWRVSRISTIAILPSTFSSARCCRW
jgi:hypothetical protein